MRLASLILGLLIGAAAGGTLGYNHGRGAPLLSNPFEPYTLADRLREGTGSVLDGVRKEIHEATR
jgi:hypothetical protein